MMNSVLFFVASFVLKMTVSQTFSHTPLPGEGMSLTLQCSTTDFSGTVFFRLGTVDKGGCLTGVGGYCQTPIDGYNDPTRQDTNITKMTITSCNETRDTGSWTCTYGSVTSLAVEISSCSEGTTTTAHVGSEGTTTTAHVGLVSTNTTTDNDNSDEKATGIGIGSHAVCLVIHYIIVIVMVAKRNSIMSTGDISWVCFLTFCLFIEGKLFYCCENINSKKIEGKLFYCCENINSKKNLFLGFTYLVVNGVIVGVIVLLPVYYGYSKFQVEMVVGVGIMIVLVLSGLCLLVVVWMSKKFVNNDASKKSRSQSCISLKSGTVTPDERQQPDGHEGPQSTLKDPDARHLTTGRPLPRRPDIASPQTGPFDSVNSPRSIVLAPIENPNIPPSIDTLDEQKTDKTPKDKKKKRKKKKMKDEEQDNPAYVQEN